MLRSFEGHHALLGWLSAIPEIDVQNLERHTACCDVTQPLLGLYWQDCVP